MHIVIPDNWKVMDGSWPTWPRSRKHVEARTICRRILKAKHGERRTFLSDNCKQIIELSGKLRTGRDTRRCFVHAMAE